MNIIDHPSPNHSPRRQGVRVDTIVMHHTGSRSDLGTLEWLCKRESAVSAHYLVCTNGVVYRLVPEDLKAWHAGLGRLPWETLKPYDFNHRSIGIELVNPGDGVTPFTGAQYVALGELLPDIVGRLGGRPQVLAGWEQSMPKPNPGNAPRVFILGHRDVACFGNGRMGRKTDPADNFDWDRVRESLKARVA